jgi:hypothetical protein
MATWQSIQAEAACLYSDDGNLDIILNGSTDVSKADLVCIIEMLLSNPTELAARAPSIRLMIIESINHDRLKIGGDA